MCYPVLAAASKNLAEYHDLDRTVCTGAAPNAFYKVDSQNPETLCIATNEIQYLGKNEPSPPNRSTRAKTTRGASPVLMLPC